MALILTCVSLAGIAINHLSRNNDDTFRRSNKRFFIACNRNIKCPFLIQRKLESVKDIFPRKIFLSNFNFARFYVFKCNNIRELGHLWLLGIVWHRSVNPCVKKKMYIWIQILTQFAKLGSQVPWLSRTWSCTASWSSSGLPVDPLLPAGSERFPGPPDKKEHNQRLS